MRDFLLRGAVVFGAAVVVLTEVLGQFHALHRWPLAFCWALAAIAAALYVRRHPPAIARFVLRPIEGAISLAAAVIVLTVGITAWLSAPNTYDALAYHLPRVVFWAQAGSVSFFPTSYFTQIILQPLNEYIVLQTYELTGGDRLVNLVTTAAFAGSIVGVSAVAAALGLGSRGQAWSALFCATLPNAILQASGAKNDLTLALWLVCVVYFAARRDARFCGLACGLALATKGTGYLFAPPLLAAVLLAGWRPRLPLLAAWIAASVLLLNGPQYGRNLEFSGSPMGPPSPYASGLYRWRNDRFGWKPTISNAVRNAADQLGGRSARWNEAVYRSAVAVHQALGIDPQDPATTWQWSRWGAPANTAHEGSANNRWHLLLLSAAAVLAAWHAWRRRGALWLLYAAGLFGGFLLFCFYLRWEPSGARFQTPLFIAASPLAGFLLAGLRPVLVPTLCGILLLSGARLPLLKNWTRPLVGTSSVWAMAREESYFSDMLPLHNREEFREAVDLTARSGCRTVGIDSSGDEPEYVFEALLRARDPAVRFLHTGVENASARYHPPEAPAACAVLCLEHGDRERELARYSALGPPIEVGRLLLFLGAARK